MFGERNVRFVETLHYYGYWIVLLDRKYDSLKRIGMGVRLVLYAIGTVTCLTKVAQDGVSAVLNATVMYVPLMIYTLVFPAILFMNRNHLVRVLNDFDICWTALNLDEDKAIFLNYYRKLWYFIGNFHWVLIANIFYYTVFPITYDTIFHYVFDALSKPYIMTYPHMSYLNENRTWDAKYYLVVFSGCYCITETLLAQLGWVLMYIVIIAYCYPVLIVTKKAIRAIDRDDGQPDEASLRRAILSHQLLVQLNDDLKAFLGLPCAFETIFISLTLTMTAFTTVTSTDVFVVTAYGSGFILHFSAGLLYCSLGQILENESEKLSRALYDLQWYQYKPSVRKDLTMMIRQAYKPFVIDFHGSYKMNLENFMEILSSAYSYFTILQTMTSKA